MKTHHHHQEATRPSQTRSDDASKKLDDLLEEKTGRKPKKPKKEGQGQGQGQRKEGEEGGGPLGELIKQMREVEDRLGKPDTGAETRKKQTEIVKNLDTLLEQIRNSPSQGQAMRMMRGGQKPGGPPQPGQGNQPGATNQGTGVTRPTPPKTPPAPIELDQGNLGATPRPVPRRHGQRPQREGPAQQGRDDPALLPVARQEVRVEGGLI